jgi:CheY-like chemotaxis protein
VLLVNPDPEARERAACALRDGGYAVTAVRRAAEAVQAVGAGAPCAVLLGGGGTDTGRGRLIASCADAGVPLLVLPTASSDPERPRPPWRAS